jgi:two-component system sensor histidine kinase MprB
VSVFPPYHPEGRRRIRRSLAARVTILTALAAGATVALVAFGAYLTVRMQLQATLDDSLLQRANQAVDSGTIEAITAECDIPAWAVATADVRIALIELERHPDPVQTCDRSAPQLKLGQNEVDVASGVYDTSIRTIYADGQAYRVAAVPTGHSGQALVVAQSLEGQQTVLRKLGIVMLLFGVAGVIGAGLAGWAVARSGLRPVRRLTSEVEEIARTEDLHPIPVEGDDEIARLATAFNQMLAALAASRDRQRQLVADAGHELRTPLTSLRTNLDLLAQADSSGAGLPPQAKAELLGDVRAQIEELTTLIGDLVELARDEPLTHVVEPVDLTEVVHQAIARVRRRAPGLTFDLELGSWYVVGETPGIERAVTNLLDNAAKWSPENGIITVRLADGTLTVDDEGPGIAEEDRPHVFDRFYRSAESRGMSGSGLGLSIVRQVAERHSGTVRVDDAPGGGARLVLWMPGSPSPVPDWIPA